MTLDVQGTYVSHQPTNLAPALAQRYSTRMFDPARAIAPEVLGSIIEAARWAPSAFNAQPWKFIIAPRGSANFDTITARMSGFNQAWAPNAAVLIATVVMPHDDSTTALLTAHHDLGQAVSHASIQAQSLDVYSHQMTGFDNAALAADLGVAKPHQLFSLVALGYRSTDTAAFDPEIVAREAGPRQRRSYEELLYP